MRAAVVHVFGPPESHAIADLPDPQPGKGEVVIGIVASEVNYPDLLFVEGRYQRKAGLPAVSGMCGAGRIISVGPDTGDFEVGQRVLVLPDEGTHAEQVRAPAAQCIALPDDVPFHIAAGLGLAFQTAHFALVEHGRFRPGESVLVLGASGGVGSAAVLLAKALGAGCVIAATRGAEGADAARNRGADAVVDSAAPDLRDSLRATVLAATDGRGADVVIDPVGGAPCEAALRAMTWRGRLISVGFASGEIPAFKANYLLLKGISACGFQWTDHRAREMDRVRRVQDELFALWRGGRLVPPISARLPLEGLFQTLDGLRRGAIRGKVILDLAP